MYRIICLPPQSWQKTVSSIQNITSFCSVVFNHDPLFLVPGNQSVLCHNRFALSVSPYKRNHIIDSLCGLRQIFLMYSINIPFILNPSSQRFLWCQHLSPRSLPISLTTPVLHPLASSWSFNVGVSSGNYLHFFLHCILNKISNAWLFSIHLKIWTQASHFQLPDGYLHLSTSGTQILSIFFWDSINATNAYASLIIHTCHSSSLEYWDCTINFHYWLYLRVLPSSNSLPWMYFWPCDYSAKKKKKEYCCFHYADHLLRCPY